MTHDKSPLTRLRLMPAVAGLALLLGTSLSLAQAPQVAGGRQGMAVSVSPPASAAGVEILRSGGNAVDAAVAMAFALAVTWPEAGNIGGGGFMMILPAPGQAPVCVEYRETAPAAATPTMFARGEKHHSCRSAGVPGTVRGLALAHQKYGKLPWPDLLAPAIRLAREGAPVDAALASSLNAVLQSPDTQALTELHRVFGKPDEKPWRAGDMLTQPELANTLTLIARAGPDAFYRGQIADDIVAEMQRCGGLITRDDLAGYAAKVRDPIHATFHGWDIYGPPPPSSGGICLVEMLQTLERFELKSKGRWAPETVHLIAETMKRSFRDRALYLGDADFVSIPSELTTPAHAAELAASIDPRQATPARELAPELEIVHESPSTTHFSVIDGQEMAVSNTYTLEQSFGARVVVTGAGFLLNNEMGDFNQQPGRTSDRGAVGTPANVIAPRKRMLSSQSPVLVCKEGQPVLAVGSPGGRTIINTVLCVLLNVYEFDMDLPQAIAESRLHHQWLPDVLRLERGDAERFAPLVESLRKMGHTIEYSAAQGDVHAVARDPRTGELQGVADFRRGGSAAGF